MAWRSRFRGYRSRARGWYRRRGGYKGIMGNKWVMFGGGLAVGYLAPRVIPYQTELALVVACAPVKVPRNIREAASGYVYGTIIRNIMGGGLGTGTSSNSPWL